LNNLSALNHKKLKKLLYRRAASL